MENLSEFMTGSCQDSLDEGFDDIRGDWGILPPDIQCSFSWSAGCIATGVRLRPADVTVDVSEYIAALNQSFVNYKGDVHWVESQTHPGDWELMSDFASLADLIEDLALPARQKVDDRVVYLSKKSGCSTCLCKQFNASQTIVDLLIPQSFFAAALTF
ncbi:MAG: hypothetical protein V3T17_07745 [Pseudomonadales bacterium]